MKIINYVLKILMLGIFVLFLTFSFNVKGENLEMNSGQPRVIQRMDDELQFPNIVLSEEIDWVNKLGVTFTSPTTWENATWGDILEKIALKYKYANIVVTKNALEKLKQNTMPLLPQYFDILITIDPLYTKSFLTIKINGYSTLLTDYETNAKIEYHYSQYSNDISEIHTDYIFTLIYTFSDNKNQQKADNGKYEWHINKPINLYTRLSDTNYDGMILRYIPTIDDELEFKIIIYQIPLLNPVVVGRKFEVVAKSRVKQDETGFYVDINFNDFFYGNDLINGDQYRFIYNGFVRYYLFNNYDNTYRITSITGSYGGDTNMLWVEIFIKSSSDVNYSSTFREEVIGSENCYIDSIKLIN